MMLFDEFARALTFRLSVAGAKAFEISDDEERADRHRFGAGDNVEDVMATSLRLLQFERFYGELTGVAVATTGSSARADVVGASDLAGQDGFDDSGEAWSGLGFDDNQWSSETGMSTGTVDTSGEGNDVFAVDGEVLDLP